MLIFNGRQRIFGKCVPFCPQGYKVVLPLRWTSNQYKSYGNTDLFADVPQILIADGSSNGTQIGELYFDWWSYDGGGNIWLRKTK